MLIFDDDLFTFDKEWLKGFSAGYRKVTRMGFVCNAHVRMFDEETARLLKEAGCRIVKFGVESGSDRIRRNVLHRYMTNLDIERSFAAAHKFGLHTSAFVMIGLPGEEKSDVLDTVRLLAKVQPGRFRWTLFFPFIGTKAYEISEEAGAIDLRMMERLDNFTDETCMDLGDEVNLLVHKAKDTFCAFRQRLRGYSRIREDRLLESRRATTRRGASRRGISSWRSPGPMREWRDRAAPLTGCGTTVSWV